MERRPSEQEWLETDPTVKLDMMIERHRAVAENPPNGDISMAASSATSAKYLESNADYRIIMLDTIMNRPTLRVDVLAMNELNAHKKQLLRNFPNSFPNGWEEPEGWESQYAAVIDPLNLAHDEFIYDIRNRYNQANVSERYKGLALVLRMFADRWYNEGAVVVDVGASENHGLKKIALADDYVFQPVRIMNSEVDLSDRPGLGHVDGRKFVEGSITSMVEYGHFRFGRGIGIDRIDASDPDVQEWVRASSHGYRELTDGLTLEQYDLINSDVAPNVKFVQSDFTDLDLDEFRREFDIAGADVVSMFTVLYQLSSNKINAMINQAKALLNTRGIIVIQDFMDVNKDGTLRAHRDIHGRDYTYRLIVIDPSSKETRPMKLLTWRNGRCTDAIIEPEGIPLLFHNAA